MPTRFASAAWPRPGLAEPRSASIACLETRDLLHQHNRKGKVVIIKTRHLESQFYLSFWRSSFISCERVARDKLNRNFTSVFDDRTSFRAKGLRRTSWNRNFTSVFDDRTSFRVKRLRRTLWNRTFTSVFGDRTSFRAKGSRGTTWKSQFYFSFWRSNLVSCERVAFRAVSLALPLPPPSEEK